MSSVTLIASDYPIPFINRQPSLRLTDRSFPHGHLAGTDDADAYINKQYKNSISLTADESCVDALRQHLNENMRNDSEVEIWSIWLGSGFKEYVNYNVPAKHIPYSEIYDVEYEIDEYVENKLVKAKHRKTTVQNLQIDDILFVKKNFYVCLTIRKDNMEN